MNQYIPLARLGLSTPLYNVESDACLLIEFGPKQFLDQGYLFIPFLMTNVGAIIMICAFYILIIRHIWQSSATLAQMSGSTGVPHYRVAYIKLGMLMVTNLVYWIPLDVLLILSLCGVDLPVEMSNWFAVFVLPIGALTDPLIFTGDVITSFWNLMQKLCKPK